MRGNELEVRRDGGRAEGPRGESRISARHTALSLICGPNDDMEMGCTYV